MAGPGVLCIITAILFFASAATLMLLKLKQLPQQLSTITEVPNLPQMAGSALVQLPTTQLVTENRVQPEGSMLQVTLQINTNYEGSQTPIVVNETPLAATATPAAIQGIPIVRAVPRKENNHGDGK